jgi:hypothetical protein
MESKKTPLEELRNEDLVHYDTLSLKIIKIVFQEQ